MPDPTPPSHEPTPATPVLRAFSLAFGWLADRKVPRPLRRPIYRAWAWGTRSDLEDVLLPLDRFPSLSAFFVRRLVPGARPVTSDSDAIASPVDGTVQSVDRIESGTILQAKGRPYSVAELLGPAANEVDLEGGSAVTIYLAPRDYHRIHSPESAKLESVHWLAGARYSVNPRVLSARERVLSINERVALRMSSEHGDFVLVFVGALNVGRIRVVGVEPGSAAPSPQLEFERGAELGRFEMGSTVVALWPAGRFPIDSVPAVGEAVRMGAPLARR